MLKFDRVWDAEYLADVIDDGIGKELESHMKAGMMTEDNYYEDIESTREGDLHFQKNVITVKLPGGNKLVATITVEEVDGE